MHEGFYHQGAQHQLSPHRRSKWHDFRGHSELGKICRQISSYIILGVMYPLQQHQTDFCFQNTEGEKPSKIFKGTK